MCEDSKIAEINFRAHHAHSEDAHALQLISAKIYNYTVNWTIYLPFYSKFQLSHYKVSKNISKAVSIIQ